MKCERKRDMENTCIVLNAFYPFNPGETFLANEMFFLDAFDQVFVGPIHGDPSKNRFNYKEGKKESVWEMPDFSTAKKLIYSVKALFSTDFHGELFVLFKSNRLTVHNIFKALRFCAHGVFCSNVLIKNIKKAGIVNSNNRIVLYSYWMNLDAYIGTRIKRKIGKQIKFVTRAHRVDIYEYADESRYIPMRSIIIDNSDKLYPISEDGKKYLIQHYNVDQSKIEVARLGTYDHGINISNKGEVLSLVSCSWVRKVKRLDLIIDALSMVEIPVCWTHFGDGDEMNALKEKLKSFVNQRVTIDFAGSLSNEKILELYGKKSYNVFINVSSSEGVPVSIMEAMSFGKLIIATDVGGTKEVVNNGENGFLLPCDFEVEQLRDTLELVYNMNDERYKEMCFSSRKLWENKSNAEKNYRDFVSDLIS